MNKKQLVWGSASTPVLTKSEYRGRGLRYA